MGNDGLREKMAERRVHSELAAAAELIIEAAGEDLGGPHFKETPGRFARMYCEEMFAGYFTAPPDMKVFPANGNKDMVTLGPINIFSLCPHHIVPWFGIAQVSYVPSDRMAGLSKFVRMARWCGQRMICQEDYTHMFADQVMACLEPQGTMIVVECKHMCMGCRGARAPETYTTTSAVRGVYKEKNLNPRDEALRLFARQK